MVKIARKIVISYLYLYCINGSRYVVSANICQQLPTIPLSVKCSDYATKSSETKYDTNIDRSTLHYTQHI